MSSLAASVPIERIAQSNLSKVDFKNLEFGKYISDHMLLAEYKNGQWQTPRVVPFGELKMDPGILALHYGQAVFEGMKAYRMHDGNISVFRMHAHHQRLNRSLKRMCMPAIPEEIFINGLHTLLVTDQAWIPTGEGSSLYIRPLVFASESRLGVKISDEYKFIIMTSPVGPYYSKPLRVKVEETYVRA